MKIKEQVDKTLHVIRPELTKLLKEGADADIEIKVNCSSVRQIITYVFNMSDRPECYRLWQKSEFENNEAYIKKIK